MSIVFFKVPIYGYFKKKTNLSNSPGAPKIACNFRRRFCLRFPRSLVFLDPFSYVRVFLRAMYARKKKPPKIACDFRGGAGSVKNPRGPRYVSGPFKTQEKVSKLEKNPCFSSTHSWVGKKNEGLLNMYIFFFANVQIQKGPET